MMINKDAERKGCLETEEFRGKRGKRDNVYTGWYNSGKKPDLL